MAAIVWLQSETVLHHATTRSCISYFFLGAVHPGWQPVLLQQQQSVICCLLNKQATPLPVCAEIVAVKLSSGLCPWL